MRSVSNKIILIAASALCTTLIACGGGGSGGSDNSTDLTSSNSEISTNYQFSNDDLNAYLENRSQWQKSVNVTYDGETYNKIISAIDPDDDDDFTYMVLSNSNGDKEIGLKLLNKGSEQQDQLCAIGQANGFRDLFSCQDSEYSESETDMFLDSTTITTSKSISLSYDLSSIKYVRYLGSTKLKSSLQPDGSMIVTTHAWFADYIDSIQLPPRGYDSTSTLGITTYQQLKHLSDSPNWPASNVVLKFDSHISGSVDDDINMYTGLLIREKGVNTAIDTTKSGVGVASGGTDLFSAGVKRQVTLLEGETLTSTKAIGVHSWNDENGTEATQIPYTDESHIKQATYFNQMLGDKGVSFYIFTIKSAPASSIYYVTNAESELYNLVTDINYQ